MNRRSFLKFLGAGVVGLAIALRTPEALKVPEPEYFSVDFEWASFGNPADPNWVRDRYLRPAAESIAAEWDARAARAIFGTLK